MTFEGSEETDRTSVPNPLALAEIPRTRPLPPQGHPVISIPLERFHAFSFDTVF